MSDPWIICTDLDRTLLPNGEQKESEQARVRFRELAAHPETIIIYASGRDYKLVEEAISEWDLPFPDYLIGDVGSTIYTRHSNSWEPWESWRAELSQNWNGLTPKQLLERLPQLDSLTLQPDHQQGEFKLSFFVEPMSQLPSTTEELEKALFELGITCNCIPSINEHENHALIDILPAMANKLLAIRFLMQALDFDADKLLYSGDSGNDIEVLASEYKSVLVANATDEMKEMAVREADSHQHSDRLYLATGTLPGLNGCYAAGIIEGFEHFFPEFKR